MEHSYQNYAGQTYLCKQLLAVIRFISHVILPFLVTVHDCATCCNEVLLVNEVVCVSEGITPNRDY